MILSEKNIVNRKKTLCTKAKESYKFSQRCSPFPRLPIKQQFLKKNFNLFVFCFFQQNKLFRHTRVFLPISKMCILFLLFLTKILLIKNSI